MGRPSYWVLAVDSRSALIPCSCWAAAWYVVAFWVPWLRVCRIRVRALCMSSRTLFNALFPMPSHDVAVWALACQLDSWLACEDSWSTCVTAAGLSDGLLSDRPEETCSSRLAMLSSC